MKQDHSYYLFLLVKENLPVLKVPASHVISLGGTWSFDTFINGCDASY